MCFPESSAAPATGRASRPAGGCGWRTSRSRSAGSSVWPPITKTTFATACRSPPPSRMASASRWWAAAPPRGRNLEIPGRAEGAANIHIGIDWLSSVSFGHISKIGKRVIVLGGGNTAMDCCRSSRRLGGEDVKVVVRSGFEEMKASPWEKEDAQHEGIPIHNFLVPKEFTHENGKLTGVTFETVKAVRDDKGRRKLVPAGEPDQHFECDDVLIAVGQENAFPWIERDIGVEFDKWDMPKVDPKSFVSTNPKVFFGGDAAFGPKNIIWAVAHGHEAAVSIDKFLNGEDINHRPLPA